MPSEQQLERSVLERKEREELRAIAQAMSLQTTSRSKKADIIDLILRAAGVEVADAKANGAGATRARKTASGSASEHSADICNGTAATERASANGEAAESLATNGPASENGTA